MKKFHLVTERSQVVLLQPGLAPFLTDYIIRNRDHLGPWEPPRREEYFTLKNTQQTIAAKLKLYDQDLALPLVALDRSSQKVIATVNVSNIVRGIFQAAHLGYGVDEKYQGQGFMTEILSAAIPEIFTQLKLHRLMANYIPTNQRSGALLQRLGFDKEGIAKDYLFINDQWHNHILTAKINPDFHF
ncbi:GNAT family N-acetyltransferase [Celerinatantimonas diazotrophica]|uniref:[SSU ribosomal protein S5P]-alanine acetyltransferase n=1 Tax=Celerinatantimonas diazotrophica TaxID=412034 RepID=A0A4R1J9T2_9GAMM|nr:GNAT family N-acetyltransferase [Celerinatantimonas diazotrophica]TCK47383.1 [SSU ribosomal protein S5P]-alanine acetyltransferase [Celerinatantimonas diazotrophica]CAG9294999.1 [Ribosomal protein S5]-alanine N-acetyltransferase [Celerinatantimonas diazotrophica]